ncbi:hypothetical protein [Desulfococcus multivorans]|uniref:Uncharacterized protein n=1 Tax=Desulfococcus multivorans DSM 2059 TaxID=1121405 RepID=S7V397_DESML|nr:hypothetical protein [Desulfococcus multivorans]AOY58965.1 conserved uncharacterized protein [Desulfococcus multivorans]AQV01232.1 hypothetical protein B2D07_10940 [Desulfococcus multivorans]EPR39128.1 hypothetical protein dsmv_2784 [Desulfococcus multivorans DSM 2059]SJZ54276.1 hypothetical protein SAMN02745446_00889 [Desulfococcus multivorans DSM 2059]
MEMTSEQLFEAMKTAAERLGVLVAEKSFRNVGIPVESGLCTVRGKKMFILDKNRTLREKIRLLGECLAELPNEEVYLMPFMREYIEELKRGG